MGAKIALAGILLFTRSAVAWNRAGHMVSCAVAYDELQRTAPATASRVASILRQHPQYESRWKPQLAGMSDQEQERYLFMLAARWPDDIRGDSAFDHPLWHYIDYPYKPKGQPPSVKTVPPPPVDNLVDAFQTNLALLTDSSDPAQTAVALCWIFHLLGDSHQPLHATMLFTTQFPEGDRGGNLFYIRSNPSGGTVNLHSYWDNLLLSDEHYAAARHKAEELEAAHPRASLGELKEHQMEAWAKKESFRLAVRSVYRNGKLKSGPDRDHGAAVPSNYQAAAEGIAGRRVTLAGYRLADLLRATFP